MASVLCGNTSMQTGGIEKELKSYFRDFAFFTEVLMELWSDLLLSINWPLNT